MKVFTTVIGVGLIFLSFGVFSLLGAAASGIGVSGTNSGSDAMTALIVSAIPFVVGCVLIYSANKNNEDESSEE